jgi:hypothetical protein
MFVIRRKCFITLVLALSLPALAAAESVYETHAEFLGRAFGESPPEPSIIWLSGERKSSVRQLLGHDYPALRLRYWCRAGRSAWVLNEIGKELPITVGVVINKDYIQSLRVLTYRENRGGEVATPSFTDQFNGVALQSSGTLDAGIDGISGATLSVQALTRLASIALFLHDDTGCKDGT